MVQRDPRHRSASDPTHLLLLMERGCGDDLQPQTPKPVNASELPDHVPGSRVVPRETLVPA
ncbi:MAG: hypothetical protein GXY37_08415 [Chloroflexi bacterium]|nr:hypothetical protein [Chloroflexota bacterium]